MGSKPWREASSVILTALKVSANSSCNFQILTLKRSSRNDFMPNGHVFPGGALHQEDSKQDWVKFFQKFKSLKLKDVVKGVEHNLPIFKGSEGGISQSLALRINAIRETFEETGILLCRDDEDAVEKNWAIFMSENDLETWRGKVNNDAAEFFNLCQHYNCYPDLGGLHLWSNWLTPRKEHKKRFDTVFFFASLKEFPKSTADGSEIENLEWFPPDVLIKNYKDEKLWLPPPQVYEVSRLLQFSQLNDLARFAKERSLSGCDRWMPERVRTLDGTVTILPGDESYQPDDLITPGPYPQVTCSNESYRTPFNTLHRIEHTNEFNGSIIVKNYKPTFGHVLPKT